MSEHDDGGPAFTAAFPTYSPNPAGQGMSLRDWFAGQALAICYARFTPYADPDPEDLATQAYFIADAMLAARKDQDA